MFSNRTISWYLKISQGYFRWFTFFLFLPLKIFVRVIVRTKKGHKFLLNLYLKVSKEYYQKEKYVNALYVAFAGLQIFSDNKELLLVYGLSMLHLEQFYEVYRVYEKLEELNALDEAIELIQEGIKLYPEKIEFYNHLGLLLQAKKEYSKAIEVFKKAIALNPCYAPLYYNFGVALLKEKQFEKARIAFIHATILNPLDENIASGLLRALEGLSEDLYLKFLEFLMPRLLAARYVSIKRGESDDDLNEFFEMVKRYVTGSNNSAVNRLRAYILHIITTGHWSAESAFLQEFREYIKGPILNVGCGTGEQSLLAAHFLGLDDFLYTSSETVEIQKGELTKVYETNENFSIYIGILDGEKRYRHLCSIFDKGQKQEILSDSKKILPIGITFSLLNESVSRISSFPKMLKSDPQQLQQQFFNDPRLVVSIDIDEDALLYATDILNAIIISKQQFRFSFITCDILSVDIDLQFNTILACYIWPWVMDKFEKVMENLAKALLPNGHLIVLGEFPDRGTPSLFLEFAKIGKIREGVSLSKIITTAKKVGLELVAKGEKEIQTLEPEYRHLMFGAVFKKIKKI